MADSYLSRSALAEKLGVTLKELTQTLIESGWLLHQDNNEWLLTTKGEFEGGEYRESKKYGRYIVWPESVLTHPAITELQQSKITVTALGKHFNISAKIMNRLLAEMGWIAPYAKGWQLTGLGKQNGGLQETHKESGVPYVSWPRDLLEHSLLLQRVELFKGVNVDAVEVAGQFCYQTLNGIYVNSLAELQIAHHLYLLGFVYAYRSQRVLSCEEMINSHFYLPGEDVHIHYQPANVAPDMLNEQLVLQGIAKQYELRVISITDEDINTLESVLSKALLGLGVVSPSIV